MKASELRSKSKEELTESLLDLRRQQMKMRLQQATGQLSQTNEIRAVRRDVARVKTVLAEKAGEK